MSQLDDLLGSLSRERQGQSGSAGGGLGDVLGGLLGGGQSGATRGATGGSGMLAALLPMLGGFLANGGLNKILSGFRAQGQSSQADSWIGTGSNEPISGAEVRNVFGEDEIGRIAAQLGISDDEAADEVAGVLPQLVDRVSPEGQLPADDTLDQVFDQLSRAGR